ncbi:uncharacterized protein [Physcomitrium patens]|uniref:Uncharacterized protein n=2 Tax=Physcomitrium patens TaxID=3218 RepID=A0A7I3ZKH7_PHYPA|nr:probable kinetochore protein NUF2 isoform X1 [Physcomitrium patens]XP_024375838.1 probable kinetochore protein NUF2 isoform X1 [Physcomitrium patens]XP_024375839.1 probable kinetochore protein NUF2 isoform X1 [Physcomitrium patens]XP_024375840.1 probable kinetochore protein NUF2 isoform X1 [Physcomitrium patens]XP_024375841.1 probable kinetochore protein NUF2 isoform X1 [Physcomitrium patens]|eukprot:XP_024375837.1 probable kinetochore protein NUF2 isoform X1 [Physcomitrella patens]
MTVNRTMDTDDVLLGNVLLESASNVDKDGVMDSPDGEIKRVICQKQREPEPEFENPKSRLRIVSRNWEKPKGDVILDPEFLSEGEKLVAGEDLKMKPGLPSPLPRARTSFVAPMSPRFSPGEHADLLEKNSYLESALKKSMLENEALKREFEEDKNNLLESLERLELANEQLLAGGENSGMEQLQMELTRLQKHNTLLSQRERELQFQLSTKDMLQKEVQHLQELNEQLLETRAGDGDSESGNKMLERIMTLETELAEAMEVNNLYKSQLHTAFAESKDAAGAPAASGDEELTKLRAQVKSLEGELQDLRDRYFVMSIRLAEREAQHEEAMMKVRRLQSPIKHFTGSFKW